MNRMKRIVILSLTALLVFACQNSEQQATLPEPVAPFALDTTLLAPPVEVAPCLKTFRPPHGFEPISEADLIRLKALFIETVQRKLVQLEQVLANNRFGAGIMVFSVNGLFIHSDTAWFFESYRSGLDTSYGGHNITETSYWLADSIYVKDFRIIDSLHLRQHVFSLTRHGSGMEVQYIVPHGFYGALARAIESSMVSFCRGAGYPGIDTLAETPAN